MQYVHLLYEALHILLKVFIIHMYGYHIKQSMDQPVKVTNHARGQLNRENEYSPVPVTWLRIWSRETAIRHWISADFIGSHNYVPMAFTAESPPAHSQ